MYNDDATQIRLVAAYSTWQLCRRLGNREGQLRAARKFLEATEAGVPDLAIIQELVSDLVEVSRKTEDGEWVN